MDNEEYIMKKLENLDERLRIIEVNYASLMGKLLVISAIAAFVGPLLVSLGKEFLSK
jgi:hypothetical protein